MVDVLNVLYPVTYEGSGQAMHPDVALTPKGWSAHRRHLVLTPYPFGNAKWENPSLYGGDDGFAWSVESGVTNPVARPRWGHLSDPALVWVPEGKELWMYYREASDSNYILVSRSPDGITWTTGRVVASAPNHALISPTVVHRAPGDWQMWSVNGQTGCRATAAWVERRTSSDGIAWSAPRAVGLNQPGYYPWHIDVIWVESQRQYWALYNAKVGTGCATPALFLATSPDGVAWTTYPSPVLERGSSPEFQDVVYRSTMEYLPSADAVRFWFSGARLMVGGYSWHIATQGRTRAKLFSQIRAKPAHAIAVPSPAAASRPPEP